MNTHPRLIRSMTGPLLGTSIASGRGPCSSQRVEPDAGNSLVCRPSRTSPNDSQPPLGAALTPNSGSSTRPARTTRRWSLTPHLGISTTSPLPSKLRQRQPTSSPRPDRTLGPGAPRPHYRGHPLLLFPQLPPRGSLVPGQFSFQPGPRGPNLVRHHRLAGSSGLDPPERRVGKGLSIPTTSRTKQPGGRVLPRGIIQ